MRIAISGAGVAGPTLAHWLLRGGHTPTLIERAPAFRTGGYVIDFWGVGYQIAQQMGLEQALHDAGYRVQNLKAVRSNGSALANVDVGAFARAVEDRYVSIARGDLAAAIYATIEGQVETLFDDTITAIDDRTDGVEVSFEKHPKRGFDLVIGADGLHSAVRRLAFGEQNVEHYLGCVVAAVTVSGYRPRDELTYVIYNEPGRQLGRFALRDDKTMFLFIFRAPDDAPAPEDTAACKKRLHREFDGMGWESAAILDALDGAEDLYFDVVSQIRLDRWSNGRVGLIGDAAAAVSLMAGEGCGLGITEAYVLAGELARSGGDHEAALAAYQRRLRPFIADKQAGALKFIPFFAAKTRAGLWVRNLGMRALTLPHVAELAARRSFADDIELPDYPWTG